MTEYALSGDMYRLWIMWLNSPKASFHSSSSFYELPCAAETDGLAPMFQEIDKPFVNLLCHTIWKF